MLLIKMKKRKKNRFNDDDVCVSSSESGDAADEGDEKK